MVSTHPKNISQHGNLPQIGMKMKNVWNHHLALLCFGFEERRGILHSEAVFDDHLGQRHGCWWLRSTQENPKPPGTVLFWLVLECVAIQIRPKRSQVLKPWNSWIFKTRIKSLHATTFFEIKRGLIGLIRNSINAGWCDRKSVFNP